MRSVTCACTYRESRSLKVMRVVVTQVRLRMRQRRLAQPHAMSIDQIYSFHIFQVCWPKISYNSGKKAR